MRLPLLIAARPRTTKHGSVVPLPSGKWHIVCERLEDSILELFVDGVLLPAQVVAGLDGHFVVGPANVQVMFVTRGSEEYINVAAERISGT